MTMNLTSVLDDRAILSINGEDARELLQGLVTADMERLGADGNIFAALLAPQGKIQFDFFIHADGGRLLIDIDKTRASDFLKRMMLYRLRSKVDLSDISETHHVVVSWGDHAEGEPDARLQSLGTRSIVQEIPATTATAEDYHTHRISLGVPEGGKDFAFDDIFPHDAMMDALGGVDFTKGCYVGQEVVSRVQHRSTARKRFYILKSDNTLPEAGATIMLDDKSVGTLGSSSMTSNGTIGLGLLRMDKVEDGDAALTIEAQEVSACLPSYFTTFQAGKTS